MLRLRVPCHGVSRSQPVTLRRGALRMRVRACAASPRLLTSTPLLEHHWRQGMGTPDAFTHCVLGHVMHSPPFRACGRAWRLALEPNAQLSQQQAQSFGGGGVAALRLELLPDPPRGASPTTVDFSMHVVGAELHGITCWRHTFAAGDSPPASPRATLRIPHAAICASPERFMPHGTLAVSVREPSAVDEALPECISLPPPTLPGDMRALLSGGARADVVLLCRTDDGAAHDRSPAGLVSAHAAILAARSPAFAAMFAAAGPFADEPHVYPVPFPVSVMARVCEFAYTDACDIPTRQVAAALLPAAQTYEMPRLEALCARALAATLCTQTAAETLLLAHEQRASSLKAAALRFCAAHADAVVATAGWRALREREPSLVEAVLQTLISGDAPPDAEAARNGDGSA